MAVFLKITRFLYYPFKGNNYSYDDNKHYYPPALSFGKVEKIAHMLFAQFCYCKFNSFVCYLIRNSSKLIDLTRTLFCKA